MDLIGTAWRGGPTATLDPHVNPDRTLEALFPGPPMVPNLPAQLVTSGYHPSAFHGGSVVQQPANYGTEGSLAAWEWDPTYVPPTGPNPHNPTYNLLVPIRWDLMIQTDQTDAVRGQVTVTQVPGQESAQFTQPGTASLTYE